MQGVVLSPRAATTTLPVGRSKKDLMQVSDAQNKAVGGESANRGEEPMLSLVQSLELLQEYAMRIASNHGLGLQEVAQAGAMATAFIVRECSNDIGGEVGVNVATFGFIEGCKTVPPGMGPAG